MKNLRQSRYARQILGAPPPPAEAVQPAVPPPAMPSAARSRPGRGKRRLGARPPVAGRIDFACPTCGRMLGAAAADAGRHGRCTACLATFTIPAADPHGPGHD